MPNAIDPPPAVAALANRQLSAYNAADLDAFCACFHPAVRVLDEHGAVTCEGLAAFRERYDSLFSSCGEIHATINQRITLGRTVVELECYQRRSNATGITEHGEVIGRYTERDGLIATAQFIKP